MEINAGPWAVGKGMLVILLIGTFLFAFTAFILFAMAYVGTKNLPETVQIGWNPDTLWEAAVSGDPLHVVCRSTLLGMRRWFRHNQDLLDRLSYLGRWGTWSLAVGGGTLAISLLYVLGAM